MKSASGGPKAANSTVLVISQVYVPDPASVGQHLHDLARQLVSQGKRVVVFTSRGGYDDPAVKYPWRQNIDGVQVRRLPFCAFGKKSVFWRLLSGLSLTWQSMFLGLGVGNLGYILVSTIPPMSGLAACFIGLFKRIKIVFWVMDLNPDELIAVGKISSTAPLVKIADCLNRLILNRADCIVALDTYMAERLMDKVGHNSKSAQNLRIIPPWPYENQLASIDHQANYFRKDNHLNDKFVVMYSGNITSVQPIDTLLEVSLRFKNIPEVVFVFIGSDSACKNLERYAREHGLHNLMTFPYLPLAQTQYSLSAADLHIVTMGDNMVGIVHPCKVYGVMSVGRPFLAFAPKRSHIAEILKNAPVGWRVEHGEVDQAVALIEKIRSLSREELAELGLKSRELVKEKYCRNVLCDKFCQFFEE